MAEVSNKVMLVLKKKGKLKNVIKGQTFRNRLTLNNILLYPKTLKELILCILVWEKPLHLTEYCTGKHTRLLFS